MNPLSLDHLTVFDAPPPEIVSIASELGCRAISLFVQKPNDRVNVPALIADAGLRRETARRMADTGVRLDAIECFILTPEVDVAAFRPALEVGASLGATAAATVAFDADEERLLGHYRALCALAAEFGLAANLEFLAFSPLNSIRKAASFIERVGLPNAGIIVDSLHMVRTGGAPADLLRVKPGLIRYAQICDGPATMPAELHETEGLEQRQIPGEGAFPLAGFAAALPPDIMIGVEVPQKALREQGVGPLERARLAVEASRRIIGAARAAEAPR